MLDKPIRADEIIPLDLLDTPFNINFWISGGCNFNCVYCSHSLPKGDTGREGMFDSYLSLENFRLVADSMGRFPRRITCASFCGIGEPLLNPDLPEMISILKKENLVAGIEVTTNASLLTHELSDHLIDAGISCLSVSIQGVNSAGYEKICGRSTDVEKLVKELEYFYSRKSATTITMIKTLDICVETDEEKRRFEELFRPVADKLHILHTVKMFQGVDYSKIVPDERDQFTGKEMHTVPYCFLPFSTINILPDGSISPCPLPKRPFILGNIKDMSLQEAWRSRKMLEFLYDNACCNKDKNEICRNCQEPNMLAADKKMPPDLKGKIKQLINEMS
jgi:MoaA/NifB/PqqE/SkfB family radical SAM enzyme